MTPKISIHYFDTIVVGSGCAAFNAADWLYDLGRKNIAIVTEGRNKGTSRNTGSDKQTYYKLSLSSSDADSVADMAQTLFNGGGVDGRIAQTEAACSVKCFIKLANLGVDFPVNAWGEYVGYKTDHDPARRATSAGPLTSKYMTEALERSVKKKDIQILDNTLIVKIVQKDNKILGLIGISTKLSDTLVYIKAEHIIWCTGGPAGVYADSVFPTSQTGMSGVLLKAGVAGANFQDWQYGLASITFRWNVSGSYQQVIPRYISIDKNGVEREFLFEEGKKRGFSVSDILNRIFLKGYQWPFDVKKCMGSSLIDLLVYHETVELGRKVYMDFQKNPSFLLVDTEGERAFDILSDEAQNYLKKSELRFGTPIQRLKKMNPLAIELYKKHSIDLYKEPLEIRVCAQHHNGGILVDENWQTSIQGLYVAGECAGTFGAFRPGGAALNSTQVGSMRAAQHIVWNSCESLAHTRFLGIEETNALNAIEQCIEKISTIKADSVDTKILAIRKEFQQKMSAIAAHIRNPEKIREFQQKITDLRVQYWQKISIAHKAEIPLAFKTYDMLITQAALVSAIEKSIAIYGSRGSSLVQNTDSEHNTDYSMAMIETKTPSKNVRIITKLANENFISTTEEVQNLPIDDDWFENVWAEHRKKRIIRL